jgi:hypothetical protein
MTPPIDVDENVVLLPSVELAHQLSCGFKQKLIRRGHAGPISLAKVMTHDRA